MERNNRPPQRQKRTPSGGGNIRRRGTGLGMSGPLGRRGPRDIPGQNQGSERPDLINDDRDLMDGGNRGMGGTMLGGLIGAVLGGLMSGSQGGGSGPRRGGCGCGCLLLIVLIVGALILFSAMGGIGNILGNYGMNPDHALYSQYGDMSDLLGGYVNTSGTPISQDYGSTQQLNLTGAPKRTSILGGGRDTVTVMIYMCGTDLEAKSGAATADLQEMLNARLSDSVNVLIETGGASQWHNSVISADTNQIYRLSGGGLQCLVPRVGSKSMTDPDTLSEFIRYCRQNFPANRYELILWDHGGGSTGGYGYDMKYPNSGSMTLDKLDTAFKDGGCTFDFIGFDACLMATLETALTLEKYGDYMIASEETEPGSGWYYTDWLNAVSENTSLSTPEIGKIIADTFVSNTPQGQTTLSVIDLAQIKDAASDKLTDFAKSVSKMISSGDYATVSNARSGVREFARSVHIDQVDLIDLARRIGNNESNDLADALESGIVYNRTGRGMGNSHGISIYFPFTDPSKVGGMLSTYDKIDMDKDYSECIRAFASLQLGGQMTAGGQAGSLTSLLGQLMGSGVPSQQVSGSGAIGGLLSSLLQSGDLSMLSGFTSGMDTGWIDGKMITANADYYADNRLDQEALIFTENRDGDRILRLKESQWDLIQNVELSVFMDDGEGYIDLGMDNSVSFDDDGNLLADYDGTWMSIDGQAVSYYMISAEAHGDGAYTIRGRVPAMLNGELVDLILEFTEEQPYGQVLGAQTDYGGASDTVAKGLTELKDGDKIDFLCDYYTYDGEYIDSYYLGEQMTVNGEPEIGTVYVDESCRALYRLTDIYNNTYWTPTV